AWTVCPDALLMNQRLGWPQRSGGGGGLRLGRDGNEPHLLKSTEVIRFRPAFGHEPTVEPHDIDARPGDRVQRTRNTHEVAFLDADGDPADDNGVTREPNLVDRAANSRDGG